MAERIAVIGGGVIGLSVALELAARAAPGRSVTVLADAAPLATTSAAAGAIWFPYAAERSAAVDAMLATTLERFRGIAREHPDAGVDLREGIIVERSPHPDRSWTRWVEAVPADPAELPRGASGMRTRVPLATMTQYLPWLEARCRALGVRFERRAVDDVDALASEFDVAIVAAGVRGGALLGDDDAVVPIRGQVVRVAATVREFRIDDEDPAGLTYVLPRRDCVVLGGTHEVGATSLEPDPAIEAGILERAAALVPAVAGAKILSRAVGLRPARDRLRIEEVPGRALRVIAAYGHGGSGMTLSWGTAERVAALLGATARPASSVEERRAQRDASRDRDAPPATVTSADELAERIRHLARQRPVVVVGIAGYGGSGKSTLARELLARLPEAARVRGDDFLDPTASVERSDGWDALLRDELAAVLDALRAGEPARYSPVDWTTGGRQPERVAQAAPVQLVDAVGLLHPRLRPRLDLAVWVDVPLEVATVRGMLRDRRAGDDHDALWREVWAPNERGFERRYGPRDAADVRFVPPS